MSYTYRELNAELYDAHELEWPGEYAYYDELAAEAYARGQAVLEIACGTGRIAIRLAQGGVQVTGMDLLPEMLEVARSKSRDLPNVRWVEGTMRDFDLGATFGLIILPGHPFQYMLTPEDQLACLGCVRRHLAPDGLAVFHLDHQDLDWLGSIGPANEREYEAGHVAVHPRTGEQFRSVYAWSYARPTQTATLYKAWEQLDAAGAVVARYENEPLPLHCVFRHEMAHALARAGFEVVALYGDFLRNPLGEDSSEMIWEARRA